VINFYLNTTNYNNFITKKNNKIEKVQYYIINKIIKSL
jgi:hypothetical protein